LDRHDATTDDRPAKEEALGNGAVASAGPVSQSQIGTGNLSPAAQVKASDPGSAPKVVNHPNKDRMQGGASSAPASPSAAAAAKPPQSQLGTEKRPWRNTGSAPGLDHESRRSLG
jgi:hypothetical protein